MISFSPSEEQQMIINMMRQFATDEMRKNYRQCDETGIIPRGIIGKAWDMGIIANIVPENCGGAGEERSAVTGVLLAEELAWGDLSIALEIISPMLLAVPLILNGTDLQKLQYLAGFCGKNPPKVTAALIEPHFNFDPNELHTKAELKGGHYLINGRKCFVPLAAESDTLLIYAQENGKTQGFILPKDTEGLKINPREQNMGIKALPTYEITMGNCSIPKDHRLGGENGCDFSAILNSSKVALAAMAVGVARAAYEYARDYAKQRFAFGEPIASRQAIAFMLAEMAIEIDATRLMVWEAAWKLDKKQDATKEASLGKFYADDMVMVVTDRAIQVLGGHGYIREHPVELWFRNARGFATLDGIATV